jgi:hypothetical protein
MPTLRIVPTFCKKAQFGRLLRKERPSASNRPDVLPPEAVSHLRAGTMGCGFKRVFGKRCCEVCQRRNCSHARRGNVPSYRVTRSPLPSVRATSRRPFGLASPPHAQSRRAHSYPRSEPRRRVHRGRPAAQPRNACPYGDHGAVAVGPGGGAMPRGVERRTLHGALWTILRAQRFGPRVCALRIARSARLRILTRRTRSVRRGGAGTSSSGPAAHAVASLRVRDARARHCGRPPNGAASFSCFCR